MYPTLIASLSVLIWGSSAAVCRFFNDQIGVFADYIPWMSLGFVNALLQVTIDGRTIISAVLLVLGAIISRYGTLSRATVV